MIDKKEIKDFFNKKIQEHGPTPEGLGWNGEEAQNIRFKQIIKVITKKSIYFIVLYYLKQ